MTPLHHPDALRSLAEGAPGLARDWAGAQLALWHPATPTLFPDDPRCADVVLAAAPTDVSAAAAKALGRAACPPLLAHGMATLGRYGGLPDDPGAFVVACRSALQRDGAVADLWLAVTIAGAGRLEAADLAAAAATEAPERTWVLPALAVQLATAQEGFAQAVEGIARAMLNRANEVELVLDLLGVPAFPEARGAQPDAAAALGAQRAQAAPPSWPKVRGSRKNRAAKVVTALTQGNLEPAAMLLGALVGCGLEIDGRHVAAAAWIAAFSASGDPVVDVVARGGGVDPRRCSAARRSVGDSHVPLVSEALGRGADPATVAISVELADRHPILAQAVIAAPQTDPLLAAVASVRDRGAGLADALSDPSPAHLEAAAWVACEEVLAALLALPTPQTPSGRILLARALAGMGERAALSPLRELLSRTRDPFAAALAKELVGA
jgi:hypothetical protein